eukprot:1179489-Prorocentrum_minimum.AAC.2
MSLCRLHYVALETTLCHSADYPMSLRRLHRVTLQTTLCRSADYPMSLCRLHYVAPQTTLCRSGGHPTRKVGIRIGEAGEKADFPPRKLANWNWGKCWRKRNHV